MLAFESAASNMVYSEVLGPGLLKTFTALLFQFSFCFWFTFTYLNSFFSWRTLISSE